MLLPDLLKQKPDRHIREMIIGQLLIDYGFLARDTFL